VEKPPINESNISLSLGDVVGADIPGHIQSTWQQASIRCAFEERNDFHLFLDMASDLTCRLRQPLSAHVASIDQGK
jgi:hypothetical protein